MALAPLKIARRILDTVDSTNTYARQLAAEGAITGTLICARAQTAGRGRHGNIWQSFDGNLFMSLILRPDVTAAHVGQLSFVAALALAETLKAILPQPDLLGLKWPNDVLVGGRKCAGILLESEGVANGKLPWVVAGIGVNLAAAPDSAVSLAELTGATMTPERFLDFFEPHFCRIYDRWTTQGFAHIQKDWSALALNRGGQIRVRLARETLEGIFEGIDGQGALNLRLENGSTRHISSGEVYL